MAIHTRNDLIQYALRKLGHPVIKISVAEEQVEDRVDEAIQYYQDFHYDGTERIYLKHQIVGTEIAVASTANFIVGEVVIGTSGTRFTVSKIETGKFIVKNVYDAEKIPEATFTVGEVLTGQSSNISTTFISKTAGDIENRYVPVSDMVTGVIRAIPWWNSTNNPASYMFDPKYQVMMTTFQNLSSSNLIYYSQIMSHLNLLDQVLRPIDSLRFNRKMSRIYIDFDWSTAEIDSFLVFECYRILDPEVFVEIYNDRMLKKLVTAKIKYQWAQNLSLYSGVQLLGGVTVDASSLMAQAVAELEAAETEIRENFETPSIGFLG